MTLPPPLRRALPWMGLLLVLVWMGLWPYHNLIQHIPWGPDSAKWVDRGTADDPNWIQWVFSTKHFIGYRPVAALSFVINAALTGYEPWGYRVTDLALHLAVGVALFDVHRRLTGDRGAWGLIAVGLVFAHPATEEVVPFVARRSYLLQALSSLASVSLALRAPAVASPSRRWGLWLSVAIMTALALLSNEGAFVVLAWLPLAVFWVARGASSDRARHLLGLLPSFMVAAAVLARRVAVLGSITGGYGKHYFAFMKDGRVMWRDMAKPDHLSIWEACWSYALAPHGVTGAWVAGLQELVPLSVLSLVVGSFLVGRGDGASTDDRPDHRWVGPMLLVWMGGAAAIVVASGTWFWRQAYFLLPPLGLALAMLARHGFESARAHRWGHVVACAPVLVLVPTAVLSTGPALSGMHEEAHEARITYGAHVHAVRRLTADIQGPGTVYLALRGKAGAAHNVRIWSNRFGADRGLVFKVLARMDNESREGRGRLALHRPGGRPQLQIDGTHIKWESPRVGKVRLKGTTRLWLDQLHVKTEARWVYVAPKGVPMLEAVVPPRPSDHARPRDK